MAPSFNDRRGQNPFQPVTVKRPAPAAPVAPPHWSDSYIGRGSVLPNGSLPPSIINGRTFTRDNPDAAGLRRRQIEIGERSAL